MASRAPLLVLAFGIFCGCTSDTEDVFGNTEGSTSGKGSTTTTGAETGATTTGSGMGGMGGAPTTGATTGGMVTSSTGEGPASSAASTTGSGMTGTDVFCNNQMCAPNQVCCFSTIAPTDHCGAKGTCGLDSELACNGPDDCPGAKCCGKKSGNTAWQYTVCDAQCDGGEVVMCTDAPNTCAANQACKPIQELGMGWFGCFNSN